MARHLLVHGLVQGVGFRAAMCDEARRLGLAGWVRNRRDGSVEAVAIGDAAALDALAAWARRGPPMAIVRSVTVAELADHDVAFGQGTAPAARSTFDMRPTV